MFEYINGPEILVHTKQMRSQDAENNTHIEGRLLAKAAILFNSVPFSKWKLLLKGRICSLRERILSFKISSFLGMETQFHLIRWHPLSVQDFFFITHVRNCLMGATPMLE